MQRYSISNFMALIALVAANFASLRLLTSPTTPGPQDRSFILLGLVPLLDVTLIGLWSASRHYRITLERRADRKPYMFVWACSLLLAMALAAGMLLPSAVMGYVEGMVDAIFYVLPRIKPMIDANSVQSRMVSIPILLGLVLSGPPILIALVWGVGFVRYRLVITPRDNNPAS